MKEVRCAIYTRKSTEDGLEQEFNSLDAQREACAAYITSQKHEGWLLVPGTYDDGGFSGGNMERPGLKALMAEVEAGRVDVIVVYKVDRLTRSLADFAKIVEVLDAKGASFVSITQAFNTTTSMGRLTLNVLLSFAQFEREVTGERIRDKIAASKKKGIWMGGPVPLGYVVEDRKLVIHQQEAERVRHIMRRYLEVPSVPALIDALNAEGIRTKIQQRASGPHKDGIAFARGSLFHLLKNPIYRGMIVHKGAEYPGEHEPIVDDELWNNVQDKLGAMAPTRTSATKASHDALLRGILFDPQGRVMVPTFAVKGSRRYHYYTSQRTRDGDAPAFRVPARGIDRVVLQELRNLLTSDDALQRATGVTDAGTLVSMVDTACELALRLGNGSTSVDAMSRLVRRIDIARDKLSIGLKPSALRLDDDYAPVIITAPMPHRQPHREAKMVIGSQASGNGKASSGLLSLLAEAITARDLVLASSKLSLNAIAKREGRCRANLTQLVKLSWVSPRIIDAIVQGQHPSSLTRARLMKVGLPLVWSEQERALGI